MFTNLTNKMRMTELHGIHDKRAYLRVVHKTTIRRIQRIATDTTRETNHVSANVTQ